MKSPGTGIDLKYGDVAFNMLPSSPLSIHPRRAIRNHPRTTEPKTDTTAADSHPIHLSNRLINDTPWKNQV